MSETIRDTDNPQAFLEAIKFDADQPNSIDESRKPYLEKAWWTRYQEHYFVYWEHTKKEQYERRVNAMLGFIAVGDVDSTSIESTYDDLLSAAITPIETREQAVESLSKLMGVRPPTKYKSAKPARPIRSGVDEPPQPPRRTIDVASFNSRLNEFTGMQTDMLFELGIWKLDTRPFEDMEQANLYIVSHHPVEGEYPCLRFDRHDGGWWHKSLNAAQQVAVSSYINHDQGYVSNLVSGHYGWKRVSLEDIAVITEGIDGSRRSL